MVVGPNEYVHIVVSRDEDGEVYIKVTTKSSPKDLELILGGQADADA